MARIGQRDYGTAAMYSAFLMVRVIIVWPTHWRLPGSCCIGMWRVPQIGQKGRQDVSSQRILSSNRSVLYDH